MRFTAKDLYNILEKEGKDGCEGLDDWIVAGLKERFKRAGSNSVEVSEFFLTTNAWSREGFAKAMQSRGFEVEYWCDDRPSGAGWFKISIPPQEE